MTTTAPVPTTCTYGPCATTGKRCARPAIAAFTGRDGEVHAECADHYAATPALPAVRFGDTVLVDAYGKTYTGTVTRVGTVRCEVRIIIGPPRERRTKVITRAIAEVRR